jgi:hypothetical protein
MATSNVWDSQFFAFVLLTLRCYQCLEYNIEWQNDRRTGKGLGTAEIHGKPQSEYTATLSLTPDWTSIAEQQLGNYVPAATNTMNESLLGSKSLNTDSRDNRQNKRGTVRRGDLHLSRLEVSSVQESSVARDSSYGIRNRVQWFQSVNSDSSFVVRHSSQWKRRCSCSSKECSES